MELIKMKITFDKEAKAGYIYFKDISQGEVEKTISISNCINIDINKNKKILGIEILN